MEKMMNYSKRTYAIVQLFPMAVGDEEKRQLTVGWIPERLQSTYDQLLISPENNGPELPIDIISNRNFFALHADKVAGKTVLGSGFLNPLLVKGTMQDALDIINRTLASTSQPEPSSQPIREEVKEQPVKASSQKTKMGNVKHGNPVPEIDLGPGDLQMIKEKGLLKTTAPSKDKGKSVLSVQDVIEEYNNGITDDEIRAWVYYKRKFGNPMNGWEKYFLSGGTGDTVVVTTTHETEILGNNYQPLRLIPVGVTLGIKLKQSITNKDIEYVIVKTPQNELVWAAVKHIKEVKIKTGEKQTQLDELVEKNALVFDGNEYFPYPVFLFGDIYAKIRNLNNNKEAIISKYGEAVFETYINTLTQYKPKMKSFRDPLKSNRPFILCLSSFANDPLAFGVLELNEETGLKLGAYVRGYFRVINEKVSLFEAFSQWMKERVKDTDLKNTTKANIEKYYFAKSIRWEKDDNGKDVLNTSQKDELIGNARLAAEDLFSEFLANGLTYEDSVALDAIWNEKYNAFTSVVQFVDKVPIAFEGSAYFKNGKLGIKPAQRQGLAYSELTGSNCLAYDVGFGKTLTGAINIAQKLSQGLIKRPLIVVPKPTYKNWLKELFGYWTDGERVEFKQFEGAVYHYGVFSGVDNIKVNDWYNLSGKTLQKLLKENDGNINKLVDARTITIVSYKGFEQMGFSNNVSEDMFNSIARVVLQKDAQDDDPREAAKTYEKVLEWLGRGNKGSMIDVDMCGFDHLTVDEAHNFKNVFPQCGKDPETRRKLFGISSSQSSRAVKMFFITNYIQLKHGKNVTLLTATPFTNSPLEIYSMLSFIGLETLNSYNLYNIKKFFEQFVLQTIEYTIDAKGEIVTKPVIKSFTNMKLLQTVLYNHFHHKDDPKEANVIRPCLVVYPNKEINTYLEMNEMQRINQAQIKEIAKSVSRFNPGAVLKAINLSLDNALTPYLFNNSQPMSAEAFVEDSPKIKYAIECIRGIKDWHESRNESCSGIIIYSNRGKSYFEYIRDYLYDFLGFKRKVEYDGEYLSEVEILQGGGSESDDDHRELVKDAFNAGVVKIIIGTSTIREGINLQSRSATTFDLYPEWNPTDIHQLKGRNWRQGNMYAFVRFVMPLVINSMDNFINQKQDEKSKRINGIWSPLGESNILENTSDLDPAEIKYELVDDAVEKFKMKYDTAQKDADRMLLILGENKETILKVLNVIDDLKESEENLFTGLIKAKPQWLAYKNYLQSVDLARLKELEKTRTIDDIKRILKNLDELFQELGKYEANRYDLAQLLIVIRFVSNRNYIPFVGASSIEREMEYKINDLTNRDRLFTVNEQYYDNLISDYSQIKKAERSVLGPYGKAWTDDLSEIVGMINDRIEAVRLQIDAIGSEEYKQKLMEEIEADMQAKRAIRGDLYEQVARFNSQNYLYSYLSDNIDRESCPIPTGPCCETIGINVVYEDKTLTENITQPVSENVPEVEPVPAAAVSIEVLRTRLKLVKKMSASNKTNKVLAMRVKLIQKMIENFGTTKLAKGGKISEDEVYIEYLNKDKKFQKDKKYFKNREAAVKWAKKEFERFDPDMIKSTSREEFYDSL